MHDPCFRAREEEHLHVEGYGFQHAANDGQRWCRKIEVQHEEQQWIAIRDEFEDEGAAKMGKLKMPKVGIRVSCNEIKVVPLSDKKLATTLTSNAKCNVDIRFKIWKWTVR
ncbi:hypothetical protein K1719_002876 [Acacia pycnantha]|nr:hypothetical protein K1719_002876 [Acacia pycnantha]